MDQNDAIALAEDSRPFNDAMLGAWSVYLKHYPAKTDSWKRMSPAELIAVVCGEWNEVRQGYADWHDAKSCGPHDLARLMYELDDLVAAASLLRARLKSMYEKELKVYLVHDGYHCGDCEHLGDQIPCNQCAGGVAWPCLKDPKEQHMHPDCSACWEFERKTFQDTLGDIQIEESSP